MAVHAFFDTSALLKRYSAETGSDLVNEMFRRIGLDHLACSLITIAEMVAVLVRKRNDGRLTVPLYEQAFLDSRAEIADNPKVRKISVTNEIVATAIPFIVQHNINATDAIILRSALDLQQLLHESGDTLLFCAADKRLIRAAQAEGITTLDPEEGTVERLSQLLGSTQANEM